MFPWFYASLILYFALNFTEVCSLGSDWNQPITGSVNDLVPNRRKAITWNNAEPVHCRIYAAQGGDELMQTAVTCRGSIWRLLVEVTTFCYPYLLLCTWIMVVRSCYGNAFYQWVIVKSSQLYGNTSICPVYVYWYTAIYIQECICDFKLKDVFGNKHTPTNFSPLVYDIDYTCS